MSSRSDELSLSQFLAGQIMLSTLMPYILPFLAMAYPLYLISKKVRGRGLFPRYLGN